ncbi:hypothetical protein [Microbacterium sp. gxy059]|uniref:hypothetical protein n=1 Tax=Microbacterium sp. gxy059 TaxID=2957199 RepID=UPI003D97E2D0
MSAEAPVARKRLSSGRRIVLIVAGIVTLAVLLWAAFQLVVFLVAPDTTRIAISDEHVGLEMRVPAGTGITRIETGPAEDGCVSVRYAMGRELTLEGYSPGCETGGDVRANGHHGRYRTIDDISDPIDPEEISLPAGEAVVFEQEYTEATNVSRSWEEPVVIVQLDRPRSAEITSLVLRGDYAELSREELVEIAGSLRSDE